MIFIYNARRCHDSLSIKFHWSDRHMKEKCCKFQASFKTKRQKMNRTQSLFNSTSGNTVQNAGSIRLPGAQTAYNHWYIIIEKPLNPMAYKRACLGCGWILAVLHRICNDSATTTDRSRIGVKIKPNKPYSWKARQVVRTQNLPCFLENKEKLYDEIDQ